MTALLLRAPAKINLCLSVLGRRPDGYHDVEMLMQMVGLYDEVRVSLSGQGVSFSCDHPLLPTDESNIAVRAAAAALARSGILHKGSLPLRCRCPLPAP